MKKLRITIGVGAGIRKNGIAITAGARAAYVARVKRHLLTTCGGYTVTYGDGGWRDETGKDWEEQNIGFVTTVDAGKVDAHALAKYVRDTFKQVCVMLTVEEVNTQLI